MQFSLLVTLLVLLIHTGIVTAVPVPALAGPQLPPPAHNHLTHPHEGKRLPRDEDSPIIPEPVIQDDPNLEKRNSKSGSEIIKAIGGVLKNPDAGKNGGEKPQGSPSTKGGKRSLPHPRNFRRYEDDSVPEPASPDEPALEKRKSKTKGSGIISGVGGALKNPGAGKNGGEKPKGNTSTKGGKPSSGGNKGGK